LTRPEGQNLEDISDTCFDSLLEQPDYFSIPREYSIPKNAEQFGDAGSIQLFHLSSPSETRSFNSKQAGSLFLSL